MKILRRLRTGWERAQAFYCRYLGRTYHCGCGHTAKRKTVLNVYEHSGVYTISGKKPAYCPECWAKAAIRCAWCGESIMPGDAITLYTPREEFKIPEHAVVYQREPHLQLVGCLRWECAEGGIDRAGFWVMPGRVQRALSPLEMVIAQGGLQAIIISDLTDPRQAILVPSQTTDEEQK